MSKLLIQDVIDVEKEKLRIRRQKLDQVHSGPGPDGVPNENWFGIALSGGGIRSATINLGFLKTLNKFGILQQADYLSTVSGGGYTHAYIQQTVKETGDFSKLFTEEHANAFRQHGEYMIPGTGFWKYCNLFLLMVAFFVSWAMSLVSPFIVGGIIYYLYHTVVGLIGQNPLIGQYEPDTQRIQWWCMVTLGSMLAVHFLTNVLLNFNLGISKIFNKLEAVLAAIGIGIYLWILIAGYHGYARVGGNTLMDYAINAGLLFIIGYFANPNALSLHRYYRKQLADLYLRFAGKHQNLPLKDVFKAESAHKKDYIAPYPIINTCLNLQNPGGDEKFKGTKASDYFILTPLFCGSKLTEYVPTERYRDYRDMTLPAAVTISAAAVNPGMGIYSNKTLSILMTLFNARLGFWISNPIKVLRNKAIVWWPAYFFRELLGMIGTNNQMVNISDGGHIENLGAYELLRRGCRLIVAFDAGEDRIYSFFDLNNLLIRSRNELGLEIRFRPDQQPEQLIRPEPSQVYSRKRYAIADIYQWWEDRKTVVDGQEVSHIENFAEPKKIGTFIYVKSSVKAPTGKPYLPKDDRLKYGTYKYKIYHPDFPHESTSDQFFDEIQWEAYYQLGQYIGADVLGCKDLEKYDENNSPRICVEQLIEWFDAPQHFPMFDEGQTRGVDYGGEYESTKAPVEPKEEVKYQM